jgi:cell division septum initiation protein DivIVA
MSEHSEYLAEVGIVEWEREVRGYNRQQVDEVVARQTGAIRDLKNSLSQCLGEIERLRGDLSEAHQVSARPPHEEISERVGQILKLAADEAKAERERGNAEVNDLRDQAKGETDKLRADTKSETDRLRADAQDRAERMLAAAQEQSERAVVAAKAEAEALLSSAQATAEQAVAEASKHAESTMNSALAQAKQQIDEATARANAIHDGAERRLNLLISRHTETVRRLTEIRDVVTSLVSGETARGSLEDEVNRALSAQPAGNGAEPAQGGAHRAPRASGPADGRRGQPAAPADGHTDQQPAVPAAARQAAATAQTTRRAPEADPLAAERHEGGRYPARPVDTTKRPDRALDEAGTAGHGNRAVEG